MYIGNGCGKRSGVYIYVYMLALWTQAPVAMATIPSDWSQLPLEHPPILVCSPQLPFAFQLSATIDNPSRIHRLPTLIFNLLPSSSTTSSSPPSCLYLLSFTFIRALTHSISSLLNMFYHFRVSLMPRISSNIFISL